MTEKRVNLSSSNHRVAAQLMQQSTMLPRSSSSQHWQYEAGNTSSLHAKLHQEAEKIRKWKIQTELDLKEKDKRLSEASTQVTTLKKSLLELQLENEMTSSKLQEEIDNRQEIMLRLTATSEMCSALKTQATKLEDKLLRCETEKTELRYVGKQQMQHFEEIATKFDNLHITAKDNHDRLLQKVQSERYTHEEEAKALERELVANNSEKMRLADELKGTIETKEILQNTLHDKDEQLQIICRMKDELETNVTAVSSKLTLAEEELKETSLRVVIVQDEKLNLENKVEKIESEKCVLEEMKDKLSFELTELKIKFEANIESTVKEIKVLQNALEEKTVRIKDCESQLSDKDILIENLKRSNDMLTLEKIDMEMKLGVSNFEIESLKMNSEEDKENIHELNGEIEVFKKKLDKVNLCLLQYQEEIENLETKISAMELDKDDKLQTIENLQKDLRIHEEQIKSLETLLRCEKDKVSTLQEEILSKEEHMTDYRKEQDIFQNSLKKLDKEILKKESQLCSESKRNKELQKKVEDSTQMIKTLQNTIEETSKNLEDVRFSCEKEREKSKDLLHQVKELNHKNKEQTKKLKSELSEERKKSADKDKRIASLEKSNDQLAHAQVESEKELDWKIDQCNKDKEASSLALRKAEEMQSVVEKEKEQAKALMDSKLAEMMATLDGYKQNSEKMLAQKDAELEMLRYENADLKNKTLTKKNEMEEEIKKTKCELATERKEKEYLCNEMKEIKTRNQKLLCRTKDLEDKLTSPDEKEVTRPITYCSGDSEVQCNPPTTPIVHVTPQKQQLILSPLTPIRPTGYMTPVLSTPKTLQRSILRTCNSVPKRRKVAFLADDHAVGSSSEDSDLMELDHRNLGKSPLRTPCQSILHKTDENSLPKTEQNQTPNLRKAPVRNSSKFFTTSPKVRAANKAKLKNQSKNTSSGQSSWFGLPSVYDFEPED